MVVLAEKGMCDDLDGELRNAIEDSFIIVLIFTQNDIPEETRKNHKGRADVVAKENFDPSGNVQRRAPR